jgi:hypothetical protein
MKPSKNSITRFAFIILDKIYFSNLRIEISFRKRFEEITSMISENAGLKNDKPRYICLNYIHLLQF